MYCNYKWGKWHNPIIRRSWYGYAVQVCGGFESFCRIVKDGIVDVVDGGGELVRSDDQCKLEGGPCFCVRRYVWLVVPLVVRRWRRA